MSTCTSKLERFRLLPTQDAQTLVCELAEGHPGYCWNGVQPWPHAGRPRVEMARKATYGVRCTLFPNSEVGIRPYGGYCRGRWGTKDCMLKHKHLGAHAAPGLLWADEQTEEADILGPLDIV